MVLLTGGAEEDSTFVGTGPEDFQLDCLYATECSWTLEGRRWAVQASAFREYHEGEGRGFVLNLPHFVLSTTVCGTGQGGRACTFLTTR
jgi:hypothetical protein